MKYKLMITVSYKHLITSCRSVAHKLNLLQMCFDFVHMVGGLLVHAHFICAVVCVHVDVKYANYVICSFETFN